jgi:hypothetical protein
VGGRQQAYNAYYVIIAFWQADEKNDVGRRKKKLTNHRVKFKSSAKIIRAMKIKQISGV